MRTLMLVALVGLAGRVPGGQPPFVKAVTGNPAEYPTLEKVFVPGLVDDVAGWVTGVTQQPTGPP